MPQKIDLVINRFLKYLGKEEIFDFYYQNERYKFALTKIEDFVNKNYLNNINILEIGGGALHFACLCSSMGWRVTVVEANPDVSKFFSTSSTDMINAEERLKDFNIDILYGKNILHDRLILQNDKFDCILLMEVIEHFNDNPLNAFGNILHLLKDGGLLYITTPNVHNLTSKLLFMLNKNIFEDINIILEQPVYFYHHRLYSLKDLKVLFNRLNCLSIEEINYYNPFITKIFKDKNKLVFSLYNLFFGFLVKFFPVYSQSIYAALKKEI